MAIIQGSNAPIIITLDDSLEAISELSVGLYDNTKTGRPQLKQWFKEDVDIIDDTTVACPLTQEETSKFPTQMILAVKGMAGDGSIIFYNEVSLKSKMRTDRGVVL